MAVDIADYVYAGELQNTRKNSVFGWIEFAPDFGIRVELTGNFEGELEGKHVRFRVPGRSATSALTAADFPKFIDDLSDRQIGVVQSMRLDLAIPPSPKDNLEKAPEDQQQSSQGAARTRLRLEWSSQDGDMLCDLLEPELVILDSEAESLAEAQGVREAVDQMMPDYPFVDADREEDALVDDEGDDVAAPKSESEGVDDQDEDITGDGSERTHNGTVGDESQEDGYPGEFEEDDEDEDPYGLFDSGLQDHVNQSLTDSPEMQFLEWTDSASIDPHSQKMYEQWAEIFDGQKDEPISYLFPKPLRLPRPEMVQSEQQAEQLVKSILAQLALLSVALDVCEHFTAKQTYRLLMQEILPNAKVHPNLAASAMVQHYATSDYCQVCEAEMEAEFGLEPDVDGDEDYEEGEEFYGDNPGQDASDGSPNSRREGHDKGSGPTGRDDDASGRGKSGQQDDDDEIPF